MVSSALDASNPKHITFITYLLKEKSKYLAKYRFIAPIRRYLVNRKYFSTARVLVFLA